MKTVYLLIGPKGSGKSYIGNLMEKELGIKFLNVEELFINFIKNTNKFDEKENVKVWKEIEKIIEEELENISSICLESVGIFDSFKSFLERIKAKYKVKLIKLETPLEICYQRIINRDQESHVKISKKNIELMNELFLKENYNYDLIIENKNHSDSEKLIKIKNLINQSNKSEK